MYKIKHLIELIKKNTGNVSGIKMELKRHKVYLECPMNSLITRVELC